MRSLRKEASVLNPNQTELLLDSKIRQSVHQCIYGAPLIAYKVGVRWWLTQGSCNHWDCPRCGEIRARKEYGRIIEGVKKLSEHDLYFYTLTCRGSELSLADAEANYMRWSNRVLTAMRTKCQRSGGFWSYVLVTERQERGHPHSHALITWIPPDTDAYATGDHIIDDVYATRDRLWSAWLHQRIVDAGLGRHWDLSRVVEPLAVSRYIAKYLFKTAMSEIWPKGWRRVRYSRSWPKLAEQKSGDGFIVATLADWDRVRRLNSVVYTKDENIPVYAKARSVHNVAFIDQFD